MRVALYARRSTEEHQAASLDVQRSEAERFCAARGWTVVETFAEDAVSRAEFQKRPQLVRLLIGAKERRFDVVVVRDETRLGGDLYRTGMVLQDLHDAGVRLFYYASGEEQLFDDPTQKLMAAVKLYASELERVKIASRTREHLETKARRGLNVGGRVYGYDNVEVIEGDRRTRVEYRINEAEAEIVREIFRRYAAGEGFRAIAQRLNARGVPPPRAGKRGVGHWCSDSIRPMLARQRYRGVLIWGQIGGAYKGGTRVHVRRPAAEWVTTERPDLRLVTEATWEAVQARMARHRRTCGRSAPIGARPRYLLSGLARCVSCGGPINVANSMSGRAIIKVYGCAWHRTRGPTVCGNTVRRPVEKVDLAVIEWLRANALREDIVAATIATVRARLAARDGERDTERPRLEAEAATLRREVERLTAALASSDEPPGALVQALATREKRLAAVRAELDAQRLAPRVIEAELDALEAEALRRLRNLRELITLNVAEGRGVIEALISDPLRFAPTASGRGARYQIEGAVSLGTLFTTESDPDGSPAIVNVAKPAQSGAVHTLAEMTLCLKLVA